jgi:hypothetical protein
MDVCMDVWMDGCMRSYALANLAQHVPSGTSILKQGAVPPLLHITRNTLPLLRQHQVVTLAVTTRSGVLITEGRFYKNLTSPLVLK